MTDDQSTQKGSISRYKLHLPPIGKGGMGQVYRTTDRLTKQEIALKRILINKRADKYLYINALAQEFRILSSLQHPNIIGVQDYGFDDQQQPYFTMEFLENAESLLLASDGESVHKKAEYIIQLLQALVYLQRRNIVHRDLKPDNALVDANQVVKVLDFGLSIELQGIKNTSVVGTVRYMAPEVIQEQMISTATDLFSVGIIAFELFTGQHPFDTSSISRLMRDILHSEPDFDMLSSHLTKSLQILISSSTDDETMDDADVSNVHINSQPDELQTEVDFNIAQDISVTEPDDRLDEVEEETVLLSEQEDITEEAPKNTDDESVTVLGSTINLPLTTTIEFPENTEFAVKDALTHADRFSTATLPSLVLVIRKLLNKDPAERYQDPYEVIKDICSALNMPIPEETQLIREGFLQAARFVGRENEYKRLSDALADAIKTRGSLWLIGGESGVGKSRLIDEFTSYGLLEGVLVLRGQAQDTVHASYHIWRDPLRRILLDMPPSAQDAEILLNILPDLNDLLGTHYVAAKPLEGAAERQRINQTITRIFAEAKQPLIILLEDLQWASNELEPLQQLARHIIEFPIMIVGTFRNDERPDLPEILDIPEDKLIILKRLQREEIRELTVAILGQKADQEKFLDYLEKQTEGNVFFVVEVLRALAEEAGELVKILEVEMPDQLEVAGIRNIIEKQLSFVPQHALPTLEAAAIAGRYLDITVLERVSDVETLDEWLMLCANIAIIEQQDTSWRFRHDKLREGVLSQIEAEKKAKLHADIAEAIETIYADSLDNHAAALTYHFHEAGIEDKEAKYAYRAGERAYLQGNFIEAQAYMQRALDLFPETETVMYINALRRLGESYHGLGQYGDAIVTYEQALLHVDESSHSELLAASKNALARTYIATGKFDDANRELEQVLAISKAANDLSNQADALQYFGVSYGYRDDYDTAGDYYQQCLELYEQLGDEYRIGKAKFSLAVIAAEKGDTAKAKEWLEIALVSAQKVRDLRQILVITQSMAYLHEESGEYDQAHQMHQQALAMARQIQSQAYIGRCLQGLATSHYQRDELEETKSLLIEGIEVQNRIGFLRGISRSYAFLGFTYLRLQASTEASQTFIRGLRYASDHEDWYNELHLLLGFAYAQFEQQHYEEVAQVLGYLVNKEIPDLAFAGFDLKTLQEQFATTNINASFEEKTAIGKKQSRNELLDSLL